MIRFSAFLVVVAVGLEAGVDDVLPERDDNAIELQANFARRSLNVLPLHR